MRRFTAYVLLTFLFLSGCSAPADPDTAQESIQVIAMDTAMLITTYGEHSVTAAYAAEDRIRELESALSRTDPDSEVSRLNAAGGEAVEISGDLQTILSQSAQYSQETGGAFDITVAPSPASPGFRSRPPGALPRTASRFPPKRSWTGFFPWWTAPRSP